MRSFATIHPTIWQTDLKKLRGDAEALAVHYHLTTSPHSTMIGIYPLPLMYIAHEIGSPLEGASKGLRRVIDAGLASYDEETEIVWVHEMVASQVAPRLSPKDNKVTGVAKLLAMLPICPITLDFYAKYRELFHLRDQPCLEEFERGFLGASKGLRSKEKEKDQEKDQELGSEKGETGSGVKEDTYTQARENAEQEFAYDPPADLESGKKFLISIGVPARFIEAALQRHMRGLLYPCDIDAWKNEERGAA